MYKMNYRLLCATFTLGLCLTSLASACTPRYGEVHATMAGTQLGVIVDEEARVVDIMTDRRHHVATELGMQVGDVVLSINEQPIVLDVQYIIDLQHAMSDAPSVTVRILRDGKEMVLTTSLEDERAEVEAASAQLNEMFEGKTEAEVDALFEKYFIPYDPKTAPPTPTVVPENYHGL